MLTNKRYFYVWFIYDNQTLSKYGEVIINHSDNLYCYEDEAKEDAEKSLKEICKDYKEDYDTQDRFQSYVMPMYSYTSKVESSRPTGVK